MTVADITTMKDEERIEKLEDERERLSTIIKWSFWSPIISAALASAGVLPPIFFIIVYAISIVTWSLRVHDRNWVDYLLAELKKTSSRKLAGRYYE